MSKIMYEHRTISAQWYRIWRGTTVLVDFKKLREEAPMVKNKDFTMEFKN